MIPSAKVVKKIGRIAQLGERCPYKAEVTGSIPVPPTRKVVCAKQGVRLHENRVENVIILGA